MTRFMMVWWLAAIVLPPAVTAQVPDWRQVKDQAAAGIVRIHVVHEVPDRLKPFRNGDLRQRLGTGFFVTKDLLVTNQHIVEGARLIKVEGVATKEKFAMRPAADPNVKFDLAVLEFATPEERARFERINGPIRPLRWAEWAEARPGEQVAVLGFGGSEQLVATQGIISTWEPRHDKFQRRLHHVTLIRTDAAVNVGNSGGPVVSGRGRVVGISARYGAGENIGLLIPFVTARRVVEQMLEGGRFLPTDPGFVAYNLNPLLRRDLGLPDDQFGVVVSRVIPDSPAARAGLKQWDVLTAVNGQAIKHGEVQHAPIGKVPYWFLYNTAPAGTEVDFELVREGRPRQVSLTLEPIEVPRIWLPSQGADYRAEWGYLGGLTITEVTRDLLVELEQQGNWRWDLVNDVPRNGKLYLVTSVEPGTQAMEYQDYGLDLLQLRILAIDGKPLVGGLNAHLEAIYRAVEQGEAGPGITLDLENHLTIRLTTDRLGDDMQVLTGRVTAFAPLGLAAARGVGSTVSREATLVHGGERPEGRRPRASR